MASKPGAATPEVTILGGKWPYRVGQIRVAAVDQAGNWFEPVWMLALFLEDVPGAPTVNILGLRSPLFDHRRLRHVGSDADGLPEWWWED